MKFPELEPIIIIEEKVQKIFSCIFRINFLSAPALPLPRIGFKNELQKPSCASIHTQLELNYALRNILLTESGKGEGKAALFVQPDHEGLFSLLSSLNLGYTLEIRHIFCLSNSEILNKDHELYNLEYFNNIFPLYLRNLNYQASYFYDSIHSHFLI